MNKTLSRFNLTFVLLIVLALSGGYGLLAPAERASAHSAMHPSEQEDRVTDVFNRVNALRAQLGLPPYAQNAALMAAAQAHSAWGASAGYFDHTEPDGSHP